MRISVCGLLSLAALFFSGCAIDETVYRLMSFDSYSEGRVEGVREFSAPAQPVLNPQAPHLSFFALGCAGAGNEGQKIVAESMAETAEKYRTDFVLYLGDNFYGRGVKSIEDPQWKEKFEEVYHQDALQMPFNAVLGNHDYYLNPEAQVEYTKTSGRWHMPARYYSFKQAVSKETEVEFFGLDTNLLLYGEADSQLIWLMEKLEASRASWKVVFGHHPLYSGAYKREKEQLRLRLILEPLLKKYGVDLYLSAHNHNIELFRQEGIYYVVSGAGSRPRDVAWHESASFAGADLGFVWVRIFDRRLEVFVVGREGKITFSETISK